MKSYEELKSYEDLCNQIKDLSELIVTYKQTDIEERYYMEFLEVQGILKARYAPMFLRESVFVSQFKLPDYLRDEAFKENPNSKYLKYVDWDAYSDDFRSNNKEKFITVFYLDYYLIAP